MIKTRDLIHPNYVDIPEEQVIYSCLSDAMIEMSEVNGAPTALLAIQDFISCGTPYDSMPIQAYAPVVFAISFVQALIHNARIGPSPEAFRNVMDTLILASTWIAEQCDLDVEGFNDKIRRHN